MTDIAHGAVAIVGSHHYKHGRAAGAITFEHDFIDLAAFELARAAHDRVLDVAGGHGDVFGCRDGGAKTRIAVGIAAAACRNSDFLDQARENFPALGVRGGFLVLDRRPL